MKPEGALSIISQGVLSRTVRDTALALDAIAGPEPGDPVSPPPPSRPFVDAARADPGRLRIGVSSDAPGGVPVAEVCVAAVREAAEALAALGHDVEEAAPQWLDQRFLDQFVTSFIVDTGANIRALGGILGAEPDRDKLEPLTREIVERAEAISAADYWMNEASLLWGVRLRVTWWGEHDVFVCPTLAGPTPPIDWLSRREDQDPMWMLDAASALLSFTSTWNVTGQPAITLPVHQDARGLPVGVQLVGPPAGEGLLLSLATQLEDARPWTERRPTVSAGGGVANRASVELRERERHALHQPPDSQSSSASRMPRQTASRRRSPSQ
jgi:amidase